MIHMQKSEKFLAKGTTGRDEEVVEQKQEIDQSIALSEEKEAGDPTAGNDQYLTDNI